MRHEIASLAQRGHKFDLFRVATRTYIVWEFCLEDKIRRVIIGVVSLQRLKSPQQRRYNAEKRCYNAVRCRRDVVEALHEKNNASTTFLQRLYTTMEKYTTLLQRLCTTVGKYATLL